jgi:hypothetical protein
MAKYLLLWEVDQTKIPIDRKELPEGASKMAPGRSLCPPRAFLVSAFPNLKYLNSP